MSNTLSPVLVIGIITYNSMDDIDACLQRLQTQTFTDFDVVILDNDSGDGTADFIAENWLQYRLIRNEKNIGFGNAHNQIISNTSSDYYLPLNPDVILTPTYIEEMVRAIEADQMIGWVAGKLYLFDDEADIENPNISKLLYTAGHAVFRDGFGINIAYKQDDHSDFQVKREVFGANAAAPLYRRTMLENIQFEAGEYFDKRIFLYHEDVDLDWRARLLGWRCIFTPDAIGYHAQGKSGGSSVKSIVYSITAIRYYSIFKHAFLFDLLTFNIPAFIAHILFMMITEPPRAMSILRYILERFQDISKKRRWLASHRKISRRELQEWYEWSKQQDHNKSYNYIARFWRGKILKQGNG